MGELNMEFQAKPVPVSPIENGYRIEVIGSVHTNVAWLENELKKVIADKPQRAEIDLSQVPFISSTGIGILTWFRTNIMKTGGSLRIVAIQRHVLERFASYARLLELFDIGPATVVSDA